MVVFFLYQKNRVPCKKKFKRILYRLKKLSMRVELYLVLLPSQLNFKSDSDDQVYYSIVESTTQ